MIARSGRIQHRVALILIAMTVAVGAAVPSLACTIAAANRTVVVTGLTPSSSGRLCMSTIHGRECHTVWADPSGLTVAEAEALLDGPIWIVESRQRGLTPGAPCSFVLNRTNDGVKPILVALLSALAAFLTGMSAAIIPRWLERRYRSRELATEWIREYLTRLGLFARTGGADAEPLPLPLLSGRDARRLSTIVTLAGSTLSAAGYLKASSENERRQLIAPIMEVLRGYPTGPSGGSSDQA